jgi:RNA polymerase sigma factor (sigma-70 family)
MTRDGIADEHDEHLEQDEQIAEAIEREGSRLRGFLRRRLSRDADVEDVLQDVFSSLVEAWRIEPIEQVGAWLFRIARNRIVDLFRKKKPEELDAMQHVTEDGEILRLADHLPSPDAGPEAIYARNVLIEALADALDELPVEQREVFVAHEIEGRSFREIAAETGVGINTLLSRKRYAVLRLRESLETLYNELLND